VPDEQYGLPLLTPDCYIDEDTLSRLFLLTNKLYENVDALKVMRSGALKLQLPCAV